MINVYLLYENLSSENVNKIDNNIVWERKTI